MKSAAGKMFDFKCGGQKVFVFSLVVLLMTVEIWRPVNATDQEEDVKSDEDDLIVLSKYKPWDMDNSADDIRCYCNLPRCVATGYMCRTARSTVGGCFSEVRNDNNDKSESRHGCIELLQSDNQNMQCDNSPRKHTNTNYESLLLCCHEDMCNHVDRPDHHKKLKPNLTSENEDDRMQIPAIYAASADNQFEKQLAQPAHANHDLHPHHGGPVLSSPGDYNNSEYSSSEAAWFKAATIAFPICGGIILLILIALAIRILKNDGIDSPSKLGGGTSCSTRKFPIDYEAYGASNTAHQHLQHLKQTPPLLTNKNCIVPTAGDTTSLHYTSTATHYACHNDLKNETQAKKNQLMTLEYSLLPQSCSETAVKPTNTSVGTASGGDCGSGGNDALANNLYRNVNLSLNSSNRSKDSYSDNKVYEKEVLHPQTYWNSPVVPTSTANSHR